MIKYVCYSVYIFNVTGYLSLYTNGIVSSSTHFFTSESCVMGCVAVKVLH